MAKFICTNCGEMSNNNYTENNNYTTSCIGYFFWLIAIFVLFIAPVIALVLIAIGIIVAFATQQKKERNCCPHCKAENCLVKTSSPKGQEIFHKYYNVIEEENEEDNVNIEKPQFKPTEDENKLQAILIIIGGIIVLIITCFILYGNSQKTNNVNTQTVVQLPDNTHTPAKDIEELQKEVNDCKALEKTIWADFYENDVNYSEKEKLINKFYDNNCKRGINENENRYGSLGYFAQAVATQTDNIQEKIKYNTIAYNNFKKDPNDKHFMESLTAISIGKQYQKIGEYNKALEWFNKVWGYYETEKTLGTGRMSALPEHIGDVLLLNGDNEKAYQYYYEALQNFENDVRGQENYYRIKSKIDSLIMGNIDYGTISSESIKNW